MLFGGTVVQKHWCKTTLQPKISKVHLKGTNKVRKYSALIKDKKGIAATMAKTESSSRTAENERTNERQCTRHRDNGKDSSETSRYPSDQALIYQARTQEKSKST